MIKRLITTLGLCAAALAVVPLTAAPASASGCQERVEIGWTAWGDAEVVSKLAAIVLGQGMKCEVELTLSDVAIQYRGVAQGDLDAMLMSWQPETHAQYLRKYAGKLVDAGPLYEGARLGLAVPSYVDPSIRTVGDLARHAEMFGGRIVGIDPNAGLTKLTREAQDTYGLTGFELTEGTGPKMARTVSRAIAEQKPVVFTAWTPHWLFGAHELRFLEDPEGVFGDAERVHAMVREDLKTDDPAAYTFFSNMSFEIDELQALMADAHEQGHRKAIVAWIKANMDTVRAWMSGR